MSDNPSGHDLGLAARGKLAKSSESILDLAEVIHQAYDLYYAPRAKRGRPKVSGTPREAMDRELDQQWAAFLAASGYDMAQHSKLLRSYWRIGKRVGALRRYSENLPNSLDAILELVSEDIADADLVIVLAETTQMSTADDIRLLLKAIRLVEQPFDGAENIEDVMADYHQSEVKHRFRGAIAKQRQAANSVGLVSIPPIEVTRENMTRVALLTMVAKHLGFMKATESELEEDLGQDFTQLYDTLRAAYWWKKCTARGIDALIKGNDVEPYLEKMLDAA